MPGALGALAVGALAVGAATIAVPAAAITTGLAVLAIAGAALAGYDLYGAVRTGNWDQAAYGVGAFLGGMAAGAGSGRWVAKGVNGIDSPPWSLRSDWGQRFDPNYPGGSLGGWWASGPLTLGALLGPWDSRALELLPICGNASWARAFGHVWETGFQEHGVGSEGSRLEA
jgi:hypothetical protein